MAVRIPKPLAEDADVKEGTVLNLAVSEGKVVATPVERKKLSLKQLLAKVTRKNLHAEVDFGPVPVGEETLHREMVGSHGATTSYSSSRNRSTTASSSTPLLDR